VLPPPLLLTPIVAQAVARRLGTKTLHHILGLDLQTKNSLDNHSLEGAMRRGEAQGMLCSTKDLLATDRPPDADSCTVTYCTGLGRAVLHCTVLPEQPSGIASLAIYVIAKSSTCCNTIRT
jgi:hypothetical protein